MPKLAIRQGGFGGGMVLSRPPSQLQPGEAQFILNCYLRSGRLKPLPELEDFRSSMTLSDTGGTWGDDYVVFVKQIGSPDRTSLSLGGDRPAFLVWTTDVQNAFSGNVRLHYVEFRDPSTCFVYQMFADSPRYMAGDVTRWAACVGVDGATTKVFATDNTNGDLYGYTPGGTSAVVAAGKHFYDLIYHKSFFWAAAGNSASVNPIDPTLYISEPDDPATWSYSYIIGDPGERITKLMAVGDKVVFVFKERSVWAVSGTPGNLSIYKVTGDYGVTYPGTVKGLYGHSAAIFLDSNWTLRAGGVDANFQEMSPAIDAEQLARRIGRYGDNDEGSVFTAYAVVNHLGHYMLLPETRCGCLWWTSHPTNEEAHLGTGR